MSATPSQSSESKVFVRRSSGLVREISPLYALFYNVSCYGFLASQAFMISGTSYAFTGGNFVAASVIVTALMIFSALIIYTFLPTAMPRAGGEYIYTSRIINPFVGFYGSWLHWITYFLWIGIWAGTVVTWAVPTLFSSLGVAINNSYLFNLASTVATPVNAFIIGTFIVILAGLIQMLGWRVMNKFNLVVWLLSITTIIICIVLLAVNSQSTFITRFNSFALRFGAPQDYYHQVITDAGLGNITFNFYDTWLLALMIGTDFTYIFYTLPFVAGEVKEVRKSMFVGIGGSVVMYALSILSFGYLLQIKLGTAFYSSINYLFNAGSPSYVLWPLGPYFNVFALILTDSPIIITIVGLSMILAGFSYACMSMVNISRTTFAWSFDGLAPAGLADVNPRFRVPIKATIISLIGAEITMWWWVNWPVYWAYNVLSVADNIAWVIVALAALLFPYLKKDIFEASPIKYRIGKVPVISIAGAIFLFIQVYIIGIRSFYPGYSWSWFQGGSAMMILLAVVLVGGFIYYYSVRSYRKSKGIDTDLAYKEIPPE